jgi:hypothetical protein
MTQISRPFQIALAALVLLVAVWFVALRGHSSSGSSSEASAPAVASSPSPSRSSPASTGNASKTANNAAGSGTKAGAHKAHAVAPGAAGLKHTIDKAQGAVKHSQHKAHGASAATSSSHAAAAPKATSKPKAAAPHPAAPVKTPSTSANTQQGVEAELKQGKVVAVLFWNPKGTVDGVVRHELQAVSHSARGVVVVHVARVNEIGSFGSFTRAVQVYSTPTILLINTKGKTSSLSGLADTFGIEQAVREVKHAK